jgi:hypothetical protein
LLDGAELSRCTHAIHALGPFNIVD